MTDLIEDKTIFNIPEVNLAKFEEQIKKLSRKAVKNGCSPLEPFVFGHHTEKLSDGVKHRVYEVLFNFENPKINGWQFVATIDHSNETGNIVRTVPNLSCEIPTEYRTIAPRCDHCNLNNKYRRDTFIIHSESGEFKQIGRTCLKLFFGINVMNIAKWAEILGYATECALGNGVDNLVGGDRRWLEVESFCATAAWAIRQFGWTSGKAAYENERLTSTRSRVFSKMFPSPKYDDPIYGKINPVTEADYQVARDALAWAESLRDKETLSDYESNISVIGGSEMMESRSGGLAASIVGVHLRNIAKLNEVATAPEVKLVSKHFAAEGDKIKNLKATFTAFRTFENDYGVTHLYTFMTEEGNVIKWFSTTQAEITVGDVVTISGTVKKNDSYNNVAQTVMTRCRIKK